MREITKSLPAKPNHPPVVRLVFVADFGTQNIHFKNKINMEAETSTNHENGNDANRLLPAVRPFTYDWWFAVGKRAFELRAYNGYMEEVSEYCMHRCIDCQLNGR